MTVVLVVLKNAVVGIVVVENDVDTVVGTDIDNFDFDHNVVDYCLMMECVDVVFRFQTEVVCSDCDLPSSYSTR